MPQMMTGRSARRPHRARWRSRTPPKPSRAGGQHALAAAPLGEHAAGGVEQPEPEARRAPVDRCDGRRGRHRKPPSTISVCAVSMREASEARNRQGPTMSSGCMTSRMHCLATWAASRSSVTQSSRWRSVMTQPGAIALTRMPSRSEPAGEALGEADDAGLGGRVGRHVGMIDQEGGRGEVDDRALAGLPSCRARPPGR